MSKSNDKGAGFERRVCRDLSKWVSGGEREDLFWRSAMSGGRARVMLNKGVQAPAQAGDIVSLDAMSFAFAETFFVECKHYKSLELHQLVLGADKGKFVSFWKKTQEDALEHKKTPLLIAKQNFFPTVICFDSNYYAACNCTSPAVGVYLAKAVLPPIQATILLYQDFLDFVNPESVIANLTN